MFMQVFLFLIFLNERWVFIFNHSFHLSPGVHVLHLLCQFAFKNGLLFMNCKSHRLPCNEEWDVLIQTQKIIIIISIIFLSLFTTQSCGQVKTHVDHSSVLIASDRNLVLKDKADQNIIILGLNRII